MAKVPVPTSTNPPHPHRLVFDSSLSELQLSSHMLRFIPRQGIDMCGVRDSASHDRDSAYPSAPDTGSSRLDQRFRRTRNPAYRDAASAEGRAVDGNAARAPGSPTPVGLHDWYHWWSCYDCMHRDQAEASSRRHRSGPLPCRAGGRSVNIWGRVRFHRRDLCRDPLDQHRPSRSLYR